MTDPSGFFFKKLFKSISKFIKKYWKPIVAIALAALTAGLAIAVLTPGITTLGGAFAAIQAGTVGFWTGVAAGALGGAVAGGIMGGAKGALYGALSGAAFGAIGGWDIGPLAKIAAHGVTGGTMSELQGAEFGSGFFSAAVVQFAAPYLEGLDYAFERVTAAAVLGGAVSETTGGSFENGAVTGAFSRLFNGELHREPRDHRIGIGVHFSDPDDITGHSFVVLTTDTGRLIVRGFYPQYLAGKDGLIMDDIDKYNAILSGKDIGRIEYRDITKSQFRSATKTIVDFNRSGANYNLVSFNCADFSARVYANSTGIKAYLPDGSPRSIWRTQSLRFAGTSKVSQADCFQNGRINWNAAEIFQTLNPF